MYRLTIALLLLAGLGGCTQLLPASITTEVPLADVEHRVDARPVGSGELRTNVDGNPSHGVYTDALIEADITTETNFVNLELHNRSDASLGIDWGRSQFVDQDDVASPLKATGAITFFSSKDAPNLHNVPRGTSVRIRLSKFTGDSSRMGFSRPLFRLDRGNREVAERTARAALGKRVRIILTLEQGSTTHEYTFGFKLTGVRVNDKPVTP